MAKRKKRKKHRFKKLAFISLILLFVANLAYAIYQKPGHIFSPISHFFKKNPYKTWLVYQDNFERYSTDKISANYLAALAQTESAGNPLATSYWRWSFKGDLLSIFHPASSAIGMYQITSPTFKRMSDYCWNKKKAIKSSEQCWLNSLRFRFSAHDSIYLVSAYLNYWVNYYDKAYRLQLDSVESEKLASIIHLCGKNKVRRYLKNGRSYNAIQRCGNHQVGVYISNIYRYKNTFTALAQN